MLLYKNLWNYHFCITNMKPSDFSPSGLSYLTTMKYASIFISGSLSPWILGYFHSNIVQWCKIIISEYRPLRLSFTMTPLLLMTSLLSIAARYHLVIKDAKDWSCYFWIMITHRWYKIHRTKHYTVQRNSSSLRGPLCPFS